MAASEPCARPKPAFVYMVRCTGGTLYTGWTTDPAARLRAHQSGRGAKYTRARGAGGFAYLELCADKRAALRREYALKRFAFTIPAESVALLNVHIREHGFACIVGAYFYGLWIQCLCQV